MDAECRILTPAGFCIFLSDPDPELLVIFGSSRSLRGLHA